MKTLETRLVNPTTNKLQKRRETQIAYRRALDEAFQHGCETQSATNDVVVQYDLSGYAKNALKQYVPQLTGDSYDATELTEDHPVKFTDEGFDIDHKPHNAYEWYLKVPHHEDYNLWVPAGINPEQRPLFEALYAGDAEPGEFRLIERDGGWYLHITVHFAVADAVCSESDEVTPVGVDSGEAALATVCHRDECGSPTAPRLWTDIDVSAYPRLQAGVKRTTGIRSYGFLNAYVWAIQTSSMDSFRIEGHEVVEKDVSEHGNGAHVYVPKEWLDETVKIVRTTENDN